MSSRFASVFVAALLCAASASAQPAVTPPSPNVISSVTVQAPSKPTVIEKQARTFVQSQTVAQNPEVGQIARWRDPVCVQVVGLPREDEAARIKARIESVAQAVGLPAAPASCIANVEVVFSEHPQQTMDVVAERREYLLGYYHSHLRNQLKKVTRPIQSWYVTATRGDGMGTAVLAESMFAAYSQSRMEVVDDPNLQSPNGCADSRLTTSCLESRLRNVFIIADSQALSGKDLGLVADYLSVLALSQPRSLDGCDVLPSVIDAFSKSGCHGRDPPDGLTPADAAYLTSLYEADLRTKKAVEQSQIASRMAQILVRANASGR